MSKGLKDAFIESGLGIGTTYQGKFPSYRIDYILHDNKMTSRNFTVSKLSVSDHYPIICLIQLPEKLNEIK